MENIQSYRQFIIDTTKSTGLKILEILWNTILPGIKDILESYSEHYEILDVGIIDDYENTVVSINDCDPLEYDDYRIIIYPEIGHGDATNKMTQEIIKRILSEFGDDLSLSKNYSSFEFKLKVSKRPPTKRSIK